MRYIIISILLITTFFANAQNWTLISPPNVSVDFFRYSPELNFASDTELWVNGWGSWASTEFGLSICGTAQLSENELLVAVGSGSYSDGLYVYNVSDATSEVIDFFYKPQFLKTISNNYYLGFSGGIISFNNSFEWDTLLSTTMDTVFCYLFIDNQHVIAVGHDNENWFIMRSVNEGDSWELVNLYLSVNDAIYDTINDKLYLAMGNGGFYSDGLYVSEDYGQNFDKLYSSIGINSLYQVDESHLILGYKQNSGEYNGVYTFDLNTSLHFNISYNLPYGDVNEITTNPYINSVNIVVSTVTGAYQLENSIGLLDIDSQTNQFSVYPNPVDENFVVSGSFEPEKILQCFIYSLQGRIMYRALCKTDVNGALTFFVDDISSVLITGTYLLQISDRDNVLGTSKFVKK